MARSIKYTTAHASYLQMRAMIPSLSKSDTSNKSMMALTSTIERGRRHKESDLAMSTSRLTENQLLEKTSDN